MSLGPDPVIWTVIGVVMSLGPDPVIWSVVVISCHINCDRGGLQFGS